MVLQKRLDYGSSSYQIPAMAYVPRSARGKRSVRKKIKDNQMCAFDLLATVAGRLLSETENSLSPLNSTETLNHNASNDSMKDDEINKTKSFETEALDQHSCNDCMLDSEIFNKSGINYDLKQHSRALGAALGSSVFVKPNISDKDVIAAESVIAEAREYKGEVLKTPPQAEFRVAKNVTDGNTADMYSSEDPMDFDTKPPPVISSDSSAEVPVYSNNIPRKSSFPKHENEVELSVDKDDDENSSGCTHPMILPNKGSRLQRIGDRRIRKLLASRHWKLAPTMSRDTELSSYDVEKKPTFLGKRMCYTRQRTQRSSFKRKKLFDRHSVSACDEGLYHESVFNLCEKAGIKPEASDSPESFRGGNGTYSTTGQKSSYEPSEYHVKLSIKSFKVPEIFIEIPENATVGSLKRTVMETVTALLGGGLHVGVVRQGKKIRDDNKTLRQVGILQNDKIDCLGFTLEPNPTQPPPPLTPSEDPHLLNLSQPAEPLARISPFDPPTIIQGGSEANPPLMLTSCPESDHDSVHSPADALQLDKSPVNSRALVALPPTNVEALALVPLHKSRRSEAVQRRIRRPFTVAEVEALVHAVEKLGTGRWRDVKIRAFDNAKHRTYVDLKDKWKTLVHTARISPQQRRGEPVPQELLDRVLSAHAYWSQQQAKLQLKPPPSAEPCLLH